MADPTEDIPADGPLGQCDGDLGLGALGLGVAGAVGIGATVEPAEQLDRPLERMEPPRPVVTDVHHPAAGRAPSIQDVELPEGEVSLLGPVVGHRADLPGYCDPSIGQTSQEVIRAGAEILALCQLVVPKRSIALSGSIRVDSMVPKTSCKGS